MKVIIAKDYEKMSEIASEIIKSTVILKENAVLGLATGSSPIGTYKYLIKAFNNGLVDFSKVKAANLDEYVGLTKDHSQSYHHFMKENFFNSINIKSENTFIPNGVSKSEEEECVNYDKTIESIGGIDLQLLGIGHNGHIAFNEPDECFSKGTNCVTLQESTISANARFFATRDEVPTKAYTMGIGTIMKAKRILLIASGKEKADIVAEFINGDITPKVPASILQMHRNVTVVIDEDAASKL